MGRWLICFLSSIFLFCSCQFDDNYGLDDDDEITNVDTFIKQLKAGTYNNYEYTENGEQLYLRMPEFPFEDIPALLKYANDTTLIRQFPVNPISSAFPYHREDGLLYLGECLLWVIEGIRQEVLFPSLCPILYINTASSNEYEPDIRYLSGKEILEVRKLYVAWWEAYHDSNWYDIDPLEGTGYNWF